MNIETEEQLRAIYPAPKERIIKKQLPALDVHCQRFIQLSPFVVIASASRSLAMDASPRGGVPGFVKICDEQTLLIPDAQGNNRLDTFENIIETGQVGLLFLIPGFDETLRINGAARLSCAEAFLRYFANQQRPPKLVMEVKVEAAYLHCPKALMRSKLWHPSAQTDRALLPTVIEMINDQTGISVPVQSLEATRANFAQDL
ncbi:MSMEG_1061 family FMN-dependent PPOX-type flavoprotein [Rhodoferax sp.]|uniref:MSMEG_1061 family FMN-dependent PPOX-type flavoprotein n=1 Tax=Rhodoferax sp. TaxID=50421 RepID=UPI0025CC5E8D|nr:MSMEG_1061 family FMN-dependent PPOX-type flavoprotein [Rhodoferax sp.]MCM2341096.1 pyridoxamine 5'-phosphate oxidase family protein [Rhodoferax sp.]